MVHQLMGSLHSGTFEDFSEEEFGSLPKRSRFEAAPTTTNQQFSSTRHVFNVPPSLYNPLDEPSPLGLRLRKSPSLLDLVQMTLSKNNSSSISANSSGIADERSKNDTRGSTSLSASDKLKASNFQASVLRIGSWEYVSKYEGDLVAKCYFAKHKLVWEVLEGGLKSKIEFQWSDITALKAELPDDDSGTLTIVLARPPAFFRETNPQPRKHTLWQATTDFTDGQASTNKQHFLQCPPGSLNKHYEKLLQCNMRLRILSQQSEIVQDSPYFKSQDSASKSSEESSGDGGNEQPHAAEGSPNSAFQEVASLAGPQLCASEFVKKPLAVLQASKETASPSSVMDTQSIDGNMKSIEHYSGGPNSPEPLKVSGLRPSMSMTDFVNHIESCISEQMTSGSLPSAKASECQDMLENMSRILLSDSNCSTALDERFLMKRVNSLYSLLQDPVIASSAQVDGENCNEVADPAKNVCIDLVNDSTYNTHEKTSKNMQAPEVNFEVGKQAQALPRKDSFSDLLSNLPRIASLPKFSDFLYGIAEGDEYFSP